MRFVSDRDDTFRYLDRCDALLNFLGKGIHEYVKTAPNRVSKVVQGRMIEAFLVGTYGLHIC